MLKSISLVSVHEGTIWFYEATACEELFKQYDATLKGSYGNREEGAPNSTRVGIESLPRGVLFKVPMPHVGLGSEDTDTQRHGF